MKLFPKADDVLNAIGAWEDSHGTGNSSADRKAAKLEAARTLGQYVRMQIVLMGAVFTALSLLSAFVQWLVR